MEKPQPPVNMNWSYVAGFFDGEGCISLSIRGTGPQLVLHISQKDPQPLRDIQAFLQEWGIRVNGLYAYTDKHAWRIHIGHYKSAILCLRMMLPYLRTVKHTVAQDAIRYSLLYPQLKAGTPAHTMLMKEALGYV